MTQPTSTPDPTAIAAAISSYESGASKMRVACSDLSEAQLNTRITPGTWSVLEVMTHLLDSDLASTHRMRRIVAEQNPLLVAYDEDAFIARLPSDRNDLREVLDLFEANRRFTARWLRTLPAADFARTGVHTQRGRISLVEIVEIYSNHVDHHLKFVDGKRKALRGG
jgi:uncharacterized damage-inducible protein DinB